MFHVFSASIARRVLICGLFALMALPLLGYSAVPENVTKDPTDLGLPFDRYFTRDKFGRKITFYLSKAPEAHAKLPLVVVINGSGCSSSFMKIGNKLGGGIQMLWLQIVNRHARVMVVEKPGVNFLDSPAEPGAATGCSKEFLLEHTLPRWAEAVGASIRAAQRLPQVDASRTLVAGISEGGIVAARAAAENPRITHVASLSGGGPTQLYDLAILARSQDMFEDASLTADERVNRLYAEWEKIRREPDSIDKLFLGHPYRRWSSFLATSVQDELLRSKSRIYIAHGSKDTSVPVESFDMLRAELAAHGRDFVAERVEGADHSFLKEGDAPGPPQGLIEVLKHVWSWFQSA
jgi:dienelactone hydrolase